MDNTYKIKREYGHYMVYKNGNALAGFYSYKGALIGIERFKKQDEQGINNHCITTL